MQRSVWPDWTRSETRRPVRCADGTRRAPREVFSVAFDPQGKFIATGCTDKKARIYSAETHALVAELDEHGGEVRGQRREACAGARAAREFSSV